MQAYSFSKDALTFFFSYSKHWKQFKQLNNTESSFLRTIIRVVQRLIIGFAVFMQNANIASFATLYAAKKGIKTLIKAFEN